MRRLTAITLIAEIGNIDGFIKPKHLVTFFGIDSDVNESSNFRVIKINFQNVARIDYRALYVAVLACIRRNHGVAPSNKILLDYYETNLNGKKPKVASVAIMYKIIKYISWFFEIKQRLS